MGFLLIKCLIINLVILQLFSSSNQSIDEQLYHCVCSEDSPKQLEESITKSTAYLRQQMSKFLLPGLGVGVSRKGQTVWEESFGLADIENNVPVERVSVWRMASISKALTSALVGHLIDEGLLDWHQSIHKYLSPNVFPIKQWNGKNVSITLDQLMSHSAGFRVSKLHEDYRKIYYPKNVSDSLIPYKDEPLIFEPGTHWNYSNFGFQVVGAVVEAVLNEPFDKSIKQMFGRFNMNSTFCETNQMPIKHRVRDYMSSNSEYLLENAHGYPNTSKVTLLNSMIMDDLLSVLAQWPSGAIMSTASDLLTFGNFFLNRYKAPENDTNFEYLSPKAVRKIWTPLIERTYKTEFGRVYNGLGWAVMNLDKPIECSGKCKLQSKISKLIWKEGGLTGLSTILLVLPDQDLIVSLLSNNSGFEDIVEAALFVAKNFMN